MIHKDSIIFLEKHIGTGINVDPKTLSVFQSFSCFFPIIRENEERINIIIFKYINIYII